MKNLVLLSLFILISFIACGDASKTESTNGASNSVEEQEVATLDSISTEIDEVTTEIDEKTQALEDALKEL